MFTPLAIRFGAEAGPHLELHVVDYQHPERAEPADLDLMQCRIAAHAGALQATFEMAIGLYELFEIRDYLQKIGTGNGPSAGFTLAGGLLGLSFAPSKRGPVLCAVMLKTIDASHVRLEYMITLEPQDIARTLFAVAQLQAHVQNQASP
ncbi:MAG TPA: hypothetical protein VFL13_10440 [Candidatus Baltobacteraceae bacterium]|nr:hypothetical protein [Candidatus Baltobacteraceae bacterium]